MFRLIEIIIDIIFFSINWKKYFDRSILVIPMTVLVLSMVRRYLLSDRLPVFFSFMSLSGLLYALRFVFIFFLCVSLLCSYIC